MVDCPICSTAFESEQSVVSHISGSKDDDHSGIGFQRGWNLLNHGSAQIHGSTGDHGSETQSENHGSETGSVLYEKPTETQSGSDHGSEPSSNQCCSAPALTGGAGDMYRLDSGDIVRLEDGDRICANCDEVIEA